jgi:hypothetical protein
MARGTVQQMPCSPEWGNPLPLHRYLGLIVSCNWASDDNWCGACEKCAFVYILFSAFLDSCTLRARVFARTNTPAAAHVSNGHSTAHQTGTASCSATSSCGHRPQQQQEQPAVNVASCSTGQSATQLDDRGNGAGLASTTCISAGCAAGTANGSAVPVSQVASSIADHEEPFDSLDHLPLFEGLMGVRGHKPLECVGTPSEVLAALYLAYCRHYKGHVSEADRVKQRTAQGTAAASGVAVATHSSDPSGSDEVVSVKREAAAAAVSALPLLLRQHLQLITTCGAAEWAAIKGSMAAADAGSVQVPTLYPAWYQLPRLSMRL